MDHHIREYTTADAETFKGLINELHNHVVELDPIKRVRNMPGFVDHHSQMILDTAAKQQGKILFAQLGDEVVGYTVGWVKRQTPENLLEVVPTTLGIIFDLYVQEGHRKQGIGKALIKAIEDYLSSQGCDSIWLDVFYPNQEAYAFYKSQGYGEREIGMLKRI